MKTAASSKTKGRAKAISVEVVAPKNKLSAVVGTAEQAAKAIADDCKFIEASTRTTCFVALRVGLRLALLGDSGVHGSLTKFIKEHLKKHGHSERTLYRFIRLARGFAADAKLNDKKTAALTSGDAIAPCLAADLQQLAAGKGGEGVVKKMVKWVGDRSLTQIYRDLAEEAPKATPKGGKRETEEVDETDAWIEEAKADRIKLGEFRDLKRWRYLDHDELSLLAAEVSAFAKEIGEFQRMAGALKDMADDEAKKVKAMKGKGGAK